MSRHPDCHTSGSSTTAQASPGLTSPALSPGRPERLLGIPNTLDLYESYPFWQACFGHLGFTVLPWQASSPDIYHLGAGRVMSEGVCFPAKLTHGHVARLLEHGANYIFMPSGGSVFSAPAASECPVSREYVSLIANDVAELSAGRAALLSCDLTLADSRGLAALVAEMLSETGIGDGLDIAAALKAARVAQQAFLERLWQQAEAALAAVEQSDGRAVLLAGHPYHNDPGLSHGIDELLASLGFAVFSPLSLARAIAASEPMADATASAIPAVAGNPCAASWTRATALYSQARFAAAHSNLQFVQLHSFGCGIDALLLEELRSIIEAAAKPYTVLKVDEMVDLAAVRIRLRSLVAALDSNPGLPVPDAVRATSPPVSATAPQTDTAPPPHQTETWLLPALAPEYSAQVAATLRRQGVAVEALPELSPADLNAGLLSCSNDLCIHMLAVAGQVLRQIETAPGQAAVVIVPQLCMGCRGAELAAYINGRIRQLGLTTATRVRGFPSASDAVVLNAAQAAALVPPGQPPISSPAPAPARRPRIAVLGNQALLFTPFLNNRICEQISADGCEPVLPAFEQLALTNRPLEACLPWVCKQGIRDVIYVQSFGCLSSHVHGRGAARRLRQQYPDVNITFIDYDPGVSEVNQLNRLKLALSIAKQNQR
ncbi:MAG: acyl-CoA dehydratase activase-related protein [Coriobacteriales bacterium]|nr:acyl-CoA dehydratase activase-related protein [Coriobacteriales bacterium]